MTMHFRIRFEKYNTKLSQANLKKLRDEIKSSMSDLNSALYDYTNPMGTANGGHDINLANKAGMQIIFDLSVIYNFSLNTFMNHMFCSYETGGPVVSYKDVNFKDPDFGPIPCNPNDWLKVLTGLKNRLMKRLAKDSRAYNYQK